MSCWRSAIKEVNDWSLNRKSIFTAPLTEDFLQDLDLIFFHQALKSVLHLTLEKCFYFNFKNSAVGIQNTKYKYKPGFWQRIIQYLLTYLLIFCLEIKIIQNTNLNFSMIFLKHLAFVAACGLPVHSALKTRYILILKC